MTDQGQGAAPQRLRAPPPDFPSAVAAFERGELEQTAVLCQATLAADPACFEALHLLGVTKSRLRQLADALALFDRALALRPGHPDVCNNRGTALVELGRLPEALASYDMALAGSRDFADAHNNRGCVLMVMDRFEDALASYGRALVLAPDNADYMNNMGRALTHLQRFDDALACFEDAIAQAPGFADAMLNRGRVLEAIGVFDEAAAAYGGAMDAGAERVEALMRRAGALQSARRYDEALADYDAALRLAPGRQDIVLGRSQTLAHRAAVDPALAGSGRAPSAGSEPEVASGRPRGAADAAIDRVCVITLDRTPDRFDSFVAQNAHLPIERISGADGRAIDRAAYVDEGLITTGNPYTPGSLGAALSHVRLWQRCAAEGRPLHIAEDDAIFRHDFVPMASAMLARLVDWDIVIWGWNFDWPMEVVLGDGLGPAVIACNETALRAQSAAFPAATTVPTMLRLTANAGTCAYSLSPAGARQLLQRCLPVAGQVAAYPGQPETRLLNRSLDIEMTRHYASLRAFVCVPCLAMSLNVKG